MKTGVSKRVGKKRAVSDLFLYRHRFVIGYFILFVSFIALLFTLPFISPNGLSNQEMESAVASDHLSVDTILNGEIADIPYHAMQKLSIYLLGLTPFAIKLPSIIIGILLGIFMILLLNRWFKNNVALIASIITVLSAPFLYLVGSGTPLLMIIFWPTVLLWLGSKIEGRTKPKTIYSFMFAICLLLSIFTPHMVYLVIFIILYAISQPHLRFTIKRLPRIPFILITLLVLGCVGAIAYNIIRSPADASSLFLAPGFEFNKILPNISEAFAPFFAWSASIESVFLSPMVNITTLALAVIGLLSTTKGFFASRNFIATMLIVFTVIVSAFRPEAAILLILPLTILVAHGMRYIIEKWYGLFPENPYARLFGLVPIATLIAIIILSSTMHFIFGYRYNSSVANQFNNDLSLIYENVEPGTTFLIPAGTLNYDFYKILEHSTDYKVISALPSNAVSADSPIESHINNLDQATVQRIATLGIWGSDMPYSLSRIITSSKSMNSGRIYIYEDK